MLRITEFVERSGLTQARAAQRLGLAVILAVAALLRVWNSERFGSDGRLRRDQRDQPDAGRAALGYALMRIQSHPEQDYALLAMKDKRREEEDL